MSAANLSRKQQWDNHSYSILKQLYRPLGEFDPTCEPKMSSRGLDKRSSHLRVGLALVKAILMTLTFLALIEIDLVSNLIPHIFVRATWQQALYHGYDTQQKCYTKILALEANTNTGNEKYAYVGGQTTSIDQTEPGFQGIYIDTAHTSPSTNCYPQYVPFIMEHNGDNDVNQLSYKKYFFHHIYTPETYATGQEYETFDAIVAIKMIPGRFSTSTNDESQFAVALMRKNSTSNTDKGHLMLFLKQIDLSIVKVYQYNHLIDDATFMNPMRGKPLDITYAIDVAPDATGNVNNVRCIFSSGPSWDLVYLNFNSGKEQKRSLAVPSEFSLESDNPVSKPRVTHITNQQGMFYVGGQIREGDNEASLIAHVSTKFEDGAKAYYLKASDLDITSESNFGVFLQSLSSSGGEIWATFALTDSDSSKIGNYKKTARPILILGQIGQNFVRKHHYWKIEMHNSTITEEHVHQVLLLGFQRINNDKSAFIYYTTTDASQVLKYTEKSLRIITNYNNYRGVRYCKMVQYFAFDNNHWTYSETVPMRDNDGRYSAAISNNQYFPENAGEGIIPIANNTDIFTFAPTYEKTKFLHISTNQDYAIVNYRSVSRYNTIDGTTVEPGKTNLKFKAFDISTGKLPNWELTGLPLFSAAIDVSTVPDCSTAAYTKTDNDQLTGGLHGSQLFYSETDANKYSLTMDAHVTFGCSVDVAICNKCPLFIEWYYTDGGTSALSVSLNYKNNFEYSNRILPIRKLFVSAGKFTAKTVNPTKQVVYALRPGVQWTVMMNYPSNMSGQTHLAPYTRVINSGKVMNFPACGKYCALGCTSGTDTCNGMFVKNQLYTFKASTPSDTKCYVYVGDENLCDCDLGSDTSSDDFKKVFNKMSVCPTIKKADAEITIVQPTTLNWKIEKQMTNAEYQLATVVTWKDTLDIQVSNTTIWKGNAIASSKVDFGFGSYMDSTLTRNGYKLTIPSFQSSQTLEDYTQYSVKVGIHTIVMQTMDTVLAEASFPKTVTQRYPEGKYDINIKIEDCTDQELTATSGKHYVTVLYGPDPVEVLSEETLKGLFTLKDATQCNNHIYEFKNKDGDNADNDQLAQFMLAERTTNEETKFMADMTKFESFKSEAVEDKYNYTFKILAHHNKNSGTYPSDTKEIKMLINFYDCNGKSITKTKTSEDYTIQIDPKDPVFNISIAKWFSPSDPKCVVKEIALKKDALGATDLNATSSKVFTYENEVISVSRILVNKGKFELYVVANTRTFDKASIKLSFTLLPCSEGVAIVSAPPTYTKSTFFTGLSETGVAQFNIAFKNLTDTQKNEKRAIIEIPLFSNSESEFCPLKYSMSSSKTSIVQIPGLEEEIGADVIKISVTLDFVAQNFSAYITAENQYKVVVLTPLLAISADSLCTSLLGKLLKDETVNKTYSSVDYIHKITNLDLPLESILFADFLTASKINELKATDCPIKMSSNKDIEVVDNLTSVVAGKLVKEGEYDYSLGDYITFGFMPKVLSTSAFSMNLTDLEIQGFREKVEITFKDILDTKLKITFEFFLCGLEFNDTEICTEDIPTGDELFVNFPPNLEAGFSDGVKIPDLWVDFQADKAAATLKLSFDIGTASDIEEQEVKISYKVETDYATIITITIDGLAIKMDVDMAAFYKSSLMPDLDSPVKTQITFTLNDGVNEVEKTQDISFAGKAAPEEEEKEDPEEEEDKKDTAAFDGFKTEKMKVVKAKNEPVAVAPASVPKASRVQPQLQSVLVSGSGVASFTFSKPMMYPKNWVKKYMSDNGLSEIDEALQDTITVPEIEFLYEQASQEPPYKQISLPQKDIKIMSLTETTIDFQIGFDSLDDPKSISLTDSVVQDNLVVQISKKTILNGQEGESLVLDGSDFDEEDGSNFYMLASLEPQTVIPESESTERVAALTDSSPAVTAASTASGLLGSLIGGAPPTEMSDDLKSEQDSASDSAMKAIAPGQVNGFNQKMQKAAGVDFKQVDFLSMRNMTWTSQPPESDSIKRMGVKTKNFPKNIGSTMIGGAGTMIAGNAAAPGLTALATALPFEGGGPESVSFAAQVKALKKKYKGQMKAPLTPTYNALIGMIFLKILLGGIVNCQNDYLIEWSNFGPDGTLSAGDQISIIVGYLGLLIAFIIFGMLVVNLVSHVPWMFNFGKKVVGSENILRRKTNHKWFLFTMGQFKTFATIYIIVFLSTADFAVPQMMLALVLNPANLFFAFNLKPLPMFYFINLNTVAKSADLAAILVIYMKLSMTDINRDPSVSFKLDIGWVILLLGQVKFYLGKIKLYSTQWLHHKKKAQVLKGLFCPCLVAKVKKSDLAEDAVFFEDARRATIDRYQVRYKAKFYKLEKQAFEPANFNKVAPLEAFRPSRPKKDQSANMYHKKQEKRMQRLREDFRPGKISAPRNVKNQLEVLNLDQIEEASAEDSSRMTQQSGEPTLGLYTGGFQTQESFISPRANQLPQQSKPKQ